MNYNLFERKIAKTMDRFPRLRSLSKMGYQRLNYFFHRQKGEGCQLHPLAVISDAIIPERPSHEEGAFFGYFDKSPWSADGKYYLTHIVAAPGKLNIALYDTQQKHLQIIDETTAFNFQQGAMLGWLTPQSDLCIFNAVANNCLVAKIVNVFSRELVQTLPLPVQVVHPKATEALTLNYKRLDLLQSEYGYAIAVVNLSGQLPEAQDGIWRMDIAGREPELIISLEALKASNPHSTMATAVHKVNHILYSPSGSRFAFMHRWMGPQGRFSRLYTANSRDGRDLYCLADNRMVSHYAWLDDDRLLAWARKEPWGDKYFLFQDHSSDFTIIGDGLLDTWGDGHPSFSPDRTWLATDTYPDKGRMRHLFLFNLKTSEFVEVGSFLAPWRFEGPNRCDLHPRWSPQGDQISIDSAHEGLRNSYIIEMREIIGNG